MKIKNVCEIWSIVLQNPSIEYCRQPLCRLHPIHCQKIFGCAHFKEIFFFFHTQQWTQCIMYSSNVPPLHCIMSIMQCFENVSNMWYCIFLNYTFSYRSIYTCKFVCYLNYTFKSNLLGLYLSALHIITNLQVQPTY